MMRPGSITAHDPKSPKPPRTLPRQTASHRQSSPPASPSSSKQNADDDHLAESLLLVGDEDDLSTIGSSLRDSINGDVFSDSSVEEPTDPWDGTDDESSDHEHLQSHVDRSSRSSVDVIETGGGIFLASPEPSMGGSYIDAEATATMTDLAESRLTIHNSLNHTLSDSQIRLIMPDPGTSFVSSSDNTTPSASLGNIRQLGLPEFSSSGLQAVVKQKPRRGVIDQEWLEASSRLWNVSPEASILDEEKMKSRQSTNEGEYMLLASQDDMPGKKPEVPVKEVHDLSEPKDLPKRPRLRAALALLGLARHWSSGISVLALASFISLALYHSYDPTAAQSSLHVSPSADAPIPTVLPGGRTVWDRFASVVEPSLTNAHSAVNSPSATPLIPDLQLIKQALSTLSTKSDASSVRVRSHDDIKELKSKEEVSKKRKRRGSLSTNNCCAVSVANSHVGLAIHSVPSVPHSDTSWSRVIRRKITRQPLNLSTDQQMAPLQNSTSQNLTCECGLSRHVAYDFFAHLVKSLGPVQHYAASAKHMFMTIYAPAVAEMHKELGELAELSQTIAETTSTLIRFIIRRAARGARVSRRALETASSKIQANMPPLPRPHIDKDALVKAREQIDQLSEYVEEQAVILAEYIQEQTEMIHNESMTSLRQAKRGLDKLILEAKKAVGEENRSSIKERVKEPMPKMVRRRAQAEIARSRQRQMHMEKAEVDEGVKKGAVRVFPKPEEKTRVGKMWDLVYHGAIALVI